VRTSAPIVSVQSPRYVDGMAGETVDGVFGDWDREEISLDELPAGGVRDADDTRLVVIAVGAKDRGAAVLAAALPPAEFRVVRARSLDEAWELVSAEHPAALAVDTCGDARAGLATLAALRGTKATAFLPLLVLDDVGVDAMDALRAGADDVLPKGAPPHEIEQALREALSRAT
jgi:CheY-like chemotaxis protein